MQKHPKNHTDKLWQLQQQLRRDFYIHAHLIDHYYFDHAATSYKPQWLTNRFVGEVNIDWLIQWQQHLANLVNCQPNQCFLTAGATYSANFLQRFFHNYLKPTDEIVISVFEHAANALVWIALAQQLGLKLRYVKPLKVNALSLAAADFLAVINQNTKIVAFAHQNNLVGDILLSAQIVAQIKMIAPNCYVIIDVTQALAHTSFDFLAVGADFIFGSAHKICGPHGLGFLVAHQRVCELLSSETSNSWLLHQENFAKFHQHYDLVALNQWNQTFSYFAKHHDVISQLNQLVNQYFLDHWVDVNGFKCLNANWGQGIFLIQHQSYPASDIAAYLDQCKIIVRSGWSCAQLAQVVLVDHNFVRVSISFLTTKAEIDYLITCFQQFDPQTDLLTFLNN